MHSLVTWTLVYVGIIALDEGGWAKWQWTKSGVSSGGRNSEGVIVVSGDMWRAYTHFAQMKVGFCSLLGCWHNSLCGCASACERWLLLKGKVVVVVCTLCVILDSEHVSRYSGDCPLVPLESSMAIFKPRDCNLCVCTLKLRGKEQLGFWQNCIFKNLSLWVFVFVNGNLLCRKLFLPIKYPARYIAQIGQNSPASDSVAER